MSQHFSHFPFLMSLLVIIADNQNFWEKRPANNKDILGPSLYPRIRRLSIKWPKIKCVTIKYPRILAWFRYWPKGSSRNPNEEDWGITWPLREPIFLSLLVTAFPLLIMLNLNIVPSMFYLCFLFNLWTFSAYYEATFQLNSWNNLFIGEFFCECALGQPR